MRWIGFAAQKYPDAWILPAASGNGYFQSNTTVMKAMALEKPLRYDKVGNFVMAPYWSGRSPSRNTSPASFHPMCGVTQDTDGGILIQQNSIINVVVSGCVQTALIPQVTTLPLEEAAALLMEAGFLVNPVEEYS